MDRVDSAVSRNRLLVGRTSLTHQREVIERLLPERRLQIILGARGVGKSTLVRQFARRHLPPAATAYLSLEDLVFDENTLFDVVAYLYDKGIRYILLDEVHRYREWSRELKLLYDSYEDLRVVVTGSSVAALTRGDFDLSRRAVRFRMPGLSWREYELLVHGHRLPRVGLADVVERPGELTAEVLSTVRAPVARYANYLRTGYFPFCLEEDVEEFYLQRVRSAAMLAIDQDVVLSAGIRAETAHKLKRLLGLVASSVPYTPNLSTVAQQLATDRGSVYQLLSLLEQSLLVRRLWAPGATPKTLAKPEKLYLQNTNLAAALGPVDKGTLRETAFAMNVSERYDVRASQRGDFAVEGYEFEVGGARKKRQQLKGSPNGFRVVDDVEAGGGDRLPLYLFGLLD